nr:retrovirus-related Pol polyprotein from transposon TNT 1-94 [Tanacetum cinerariifolium]
MARDVTVVVLTTIDQLILREKMKFLLTAFKVYYVLEGAQMGILTEEEQRKHDKDETLCRRYHLSTLTDRSHIKRYCKNPKKKNQNSNKKDESANAIKQVDTTETTAMVSEMNIEMIQELHIASVTTTDDWWCDSSATTHVIRSGNVEIQFTSEKKLILMNVLHVRNIRKNLVSGFKLCKSGVKVVIESDKARALAEATLRERDELVFAQCEKIRLLEEQSEPFYEVSEFDLEIVLDTQNNSEKDLILSLQTQVKKTAELVVRFSDEKYFALKEIESLNDGIKSLQIENQDLKSRESELNNL